MSADELSKLLDEYGIKHGPVVVWVQILAVAVFFYMIFASMETNESFRGLDLLVCSLNTTSLLMAYQAELEEEMTDDPDPVLWEELCIITYACTRWQYRHRTEPRGK
ncbi:hypothetical protein D4764_08G0005510 [Takifugu flavidus]|uniref:Uncharacterized protein n=1 Tax=Takifugu flavidus TaxID=433684 RepID=A0A5C6MMT3_9TELE|nr:hypothetical protein D4764_08G0005510 [Takifugu flavidus]